jgi:hypothetical protein
MEARLARDGVADHQCRRSHVLRGLKELSPKTAPGVQHGAREHPDDEERLLAQARKDDERPVMEEKLVGEDVVERVRDRTKDGSVHPGERSFVGDAVGVVDGRDCGRAAASRRESAFAFSGRSCSAAIAASTSSGSRRASEATAVSRCCWG